MPAVRAWGAQQARGRIAPMSLVRREPGPHDVCIDIAYCGICHSDVHQVRDEWGQGHFPMVPGHEIVGHVRAVGGAVRRFAVGDVAGVGCMVGSCGTCAMCRADAQQFCTAHCALTYASTEMDGHTPTQGGYAQAIVVDERFVLRVPPGLPLPRVAPLLCAGITTWAPLQRFQAGPGKRLAVLGLGGLGHMAVKLGAALGAEVTVLSGSPHKQADAAGLGAHAFALTQQRATMARLRGHFDLVLDTVSGPHDVDAYLGLLRPLGTLVLLGIAPAPLSVRATTLVTQQRAVCGSLIGGIEATQQMLDFCAVRGVLADVEVIAADGIEAAYGRLLRGDVKYRFVVDVASMATAAVTA